MNEFLEKIKSFFKDEESFFDAKQLLGQNWHNFVPQYFDKILETRTNSVFVLDREGNYTYVNAKGEEMAGKSAEEMLGQNIWNLFPVLKTLEFGTHLQEAIEEKKTFRSEETYFDGMGWYDMQVFPQENFTIIIATEVTHAKNAKDEFSQIITKNKTILNALPDSLYGIHRNGKTINHKEFPHFTGWDCKDKETNLRYSDISEIFPENILEEIRSILEQVIDLGETKTVEYSLHDSDGQKCFEARFTKTGDVDALAIIRNITERKKAEALKNEFISLVSHELRTPLTSIKGSIDLLLAGVAGEVSNQTKSLLNICRKNTQRLVRFVTDLLDIEALDSGNINFKFRSYSLKEILQTSVDGMRTFAEQYHVLLNFDSNFPQTTVYVDEDRLNHCITNLISNAVKYTPKFSEVTISVQSDDTKAKILIKDNGPGIDPNFAPRLFHRFAQGAPPKDKLVGGSGLGLSITKGFVEAMKGNIYFLSDDTGTVFTIELPIVKPGQIPAGFGQ
ncbi:PAS domain S-box protein [Leptospira levettii]|uniref:PAS domain-containing sensor histidine kinase n=1 Tax=Leptospira levettii TaxID=2023178 RepID=UPI001083F3C8|nr:ATP-binding protein [Leptospira levettii]TGM36306.1 PAS domain S-box protein [Leptospira levettii]TGM69663.1 PAS domain S-box protein [Leptospira levettii]TGM84046.1 PAS domain S-box protein [Leptospira levettii]